jgi:VCBS repeat-containing protein
MRKNAIWLTMILGLSLVSFHSLGFNSQRVSASGTLSSQMNARAVNELMSFITGTSSRMFILSPPVTTFVVTTTADNLDNNNPTPGSLRAAIRDANLNPGADTIEFNIPGAGPHTINVGTGLSEIKDTVTIDGYTQPGASPNTLPDGNNAVLKVEIKGQPNLYGDGLVIGASDCVVQGLAIHGFNRAIVVAGDRTVAGANGNIVRGNFLGTNVTGAAVSVDYGNGTGNFGGGVLIDGGGFKPNGDPGTANNNIIGGTTPAARNVISGNGSFGVQITQNIASATATGNLVQGNFIGANAAGTAALGNGGGVVIATSGNTIGGALDGARNIISGNNYNPFTSNGVNIDGINAHDNKVQGNFIGTDVTGTVAIANAVHGVNIGNTAHDNLVGGTTATARNIISGNVQSGVALGTNTANNSVKGNYIGTDVTGTLALPNGFLGVLLDQSLSATIGGAEPGAGNLISANARGGVDVGGSNTVVQGNLIGTKADGVGPLGNAQFGVRVYGPNNLIGGRTIGAGNIIAFTRFADPFSDNAIGVIVYGGNTNTTIAGNSIHSNEGIGIDLGRNWLTANDNCDGDSSDGTSNKLQNYPVLTSAASGGSSTTIAGTLDSAAGTTFTLDFYANPACDSFNFGEGQTYLGSATAATDGACNATFNVTLPIAVPAGQVVTATATDPGGNTSEFSACVTVTLSNSPPDAVNDMATTNEDTPVTINVLANDTDPDGDTLTISSFSQGANGSVTNGVGGTLTYSPNANYNGTDSFTYTISDGHGGMDTATVTITINAVNDAPDAVDDTASTNENTAVNINVRANDTGGDCGAVNIKAVTQGAHGTVVINPDSTLRYTPNANFNGADSFTYTIGCAAAGNDTANVTVTVVPVNDAPVANNDSYNTNEDIGLNVNAATGVLANDTDADGDALTAALVSGTSHGSLTLNPNGSFSYTPNANFNGTDTFTYTVSDGHGGTDTATVTITVTPANDAPVAVNDSYSANEDVVLTVPAAGVLANDTDVEGDALTATLVTGPASGALTLNPDGSFTYTPNANFNGTDSFIYRAKDAGNALSNVANVTITVNAVNDPPNARDDAATTAEDTPVTVSVLANDTDVEGDALAVGSVAQPAHGSVVINADGTVTYTPTANYNGTDTFTYIVSDGHGGTDTATVTITVTPVNDAPDAKDDAATTPEDTPVSINVLANDTDADGDTLSVQSVTQAAHGSVSINADSTVRYTPNANYNGGDAFTYTISDGHGGTDTATVTVTVTPVNDAPVAIGDSYITNEDTILSVPAPGVLANDSDPEGSALSALLVTSPTHGVLGWNANGSFTYTPAANYNGSDSFTYKANDGSLSSNVATVNITIIPVNDPPAAVNDSYSTNQNTTLNVTAPGVLSNDSDVDSPTLSASLASGPASGTLALNANGSFTYTPANNFTGTVTFTYRASDGALTSNPATVTIAVNAVSNPTWRATGNLNIGRVEHTATLLPNGKVLVAGGYDSRDFLNSAELYDPATGKWSRTGNLTTARGGHTATLLLNGKVLVAGGNLSSPLVVNSAEIFDPATETWSATGNLVAFRLGHTATLLPSGKVLVVGGFGSSNSAELYDPANGTWSATGNPAVARGVHTATLLPNGKVLVAGGANNSSGILNSAELYSPDTGTWAATGNLSTRRRYHTATLLISGRVLVAGGLTDLGMGAPISQGAELYDPAAGTWVVTADLKFARAAHTATLLPNLMVLAAGGVGGTHTITNSSELYNPILGGTWSTTANLITARYLYTATLLPNGQVLAAGGIGDASNILKSAELYGPLDAPPSGSFTVTQLNTLFGFGWTSSGGAFALKGNLLHHDTVVSGAGPYQLLGGFWR